MRKIFYTLLASITLNANAMTPPDNMVTIDYGKAVVQHHPGLEQCEWAYDGEQFTVFYDDEEFIVQPAFVDPALRNLSKGQLISLLNYVYLYINRLDNGEFTIKAKMRLEGGMRRRKRQPMLVLVGMAAFVGVWKGVEYLCGGNQAVPIHPELRAGHVAEIVQKAVNVAPGIKSDSNKVHIAEPACLVGGGLPRAIIGGGAQKGPWMQMAPKPLSPAPSAPQAPRPPGAPQAPRPAPQAPRPVAPIPPAIPRLA